MEPASDIGSEGKGPASCSSTAACNLRKTSTDWRRRCRARFGCAFMIDGGAARSGGFGPAYGLARETEDLSALLAQTGARYVFGLSSGALIALHATLELPITKLAIYEPPFTIGEADPARWVGQYERAIERSDLAAAMVTVLKGTGDARVLTYLPSLLLVPMLRQGIRKGATEGDDSV